MYSAKCLGIQASGGRLQGPHVVETRESCPRKTQRSRPPRDPTTDLSCGAKLGWLLSLSSTADERARPSAGSPESWCLPRVPICMAGRGLVGKRRGGDRLQPRQLHVFPPGAFVVIAGLGSETEGWPWPDWRCLPCPATGWWCCCCSCQVQPLQQACCFHSATLFPPVCLCSLHPPVSHFLPRSPSAALGPECVGISSGVCDELRGLRSTQPAPVCIIRLS